MRGAPRTPLFPYTTLFRSQAHAKRNFGFERVANRSGNAGVGHGNDDVGFHRMLVREQAAKHFAALVDGAAEDNAVRAREIDVLRSEEHTSELQSLAYLVCR